MTCAEASSISPVRNAMSFHNANGIAAMGGWVLRGMALRVGRSAPVRRGDARLQKSLRRGHLGAGMLAGRHRCDAHGHLMGAPVVDEPHPLAGLDAFVL